MLATIKKLIIFFMILGFVGLARDQVFSRQKPTRNLQTIETYYKDNTWRIS